MGNRTFLFGTGITYLKTIGGVEQTYKVGTQQDIELSFAGSLKELFGQNEFAEDVARAEISASGKFSYGQRNIAMENAVFVAATINSSGSEAITEDSATIADAVITDWVEDLGVVWTTGDDASLALTRVSDTPSAGEYTVTDGTYGFNADDVTAGNSISKSYLQTNADGTGYDIEDKIAGQAPKFKLVWEGEYDGNKVTLVLNSCVSESLSMLAASRGEHQIQEIPFKVCVDDTGSVGSFFQNAE